MGYEGATYKNFNVIINFIANTLLPRLSTDSHESNAWFRIMPIFCNVNVSCKKKKKKGGVQSHIALFCLMPKKYFFL